MQVFRFIFNLAASQDCKEFQGELFGICNLFRDLSDKLFTSDIIELHEKQAHEDRIHRIQKQDLAELGMYFVPSEEENEKMSSRTEASKSKDMMRSSTTKPVLADIGELFIYHSSSYYVFLASASRSSFEKQKRQLMLWWSYPREL